MAFLSDIPQRLSSSQAMLSFHGLTESESHSIATALGDSAENLSLTALPNTRSGEVLLSAAFLIAAVKTTPAILKALTEMLVELRKSRYFTVKLQLSNGSSLEGTVSPDRIQSLIQHLDQLNSRNE